jgi:hypothetical protein
VRAGTAATPVALIVLAAGAASYAYMIDRHQVSDADRAARPRDVFPSFRVDQVTRVEIDQGAERFVLERDDEAGPSPSAWTIVARHREPADAGCVDMLLRELELATRVRDVADANGTGLSAPRVRGRVAVGALDYRFALGADAPRPEGGAYMQVDGEGMFVVERSLKVQLLRGVDAYRDRMIVMMGSNDVARIEVRRPDGPGFSLARSGAGFRVGSDAELRASRSAVDRIFSALAEARADSFLEDTDAARATATALTVTVAPREAGRPRLELRIGGPCPGQPDDVVVVRTLERSESADATSMRRTLERSESADATSMLHASRATEAVCTARALLEAMSATPEALIDRSALFAHADEIEQMRLESTEPSGVVVELARKGTGWRQRAPEDRDLDADESDAANSLALALVRAQSIETPRAALGERFAVRTRATIIRSGNGSSEVVELAAPAADGAALARRVDDGAILRLPRAVARRFQPHPVALRPRAIWRQSWDAGAAVAVDNGCVPASERLELRDGRWVMRAPAGFPADPPLVVDLIGAIARAKADAWIAEGDDGSFGFDREGTCTVTVTVNGPASGSGARRASLVFGAEGEGGVYARTLGDAAVFIAPKSLRDLASHPAIDRSRMRLDLDTLKSATLLRGGAALVLERAGEHLVRRGKDVVDAGGDDRIERALAGLYASAAVHIGPPRRDEGIDRATLEILAHATADSGPGETRIVVGAPARVDGTEVYFARASGIDATFVIPRGAVNAILDAW